MGIEPTKNSKAETPTGPEHGIGRDLSAFTTGVSREGLVDVLKALIAEASPETQRTICARIQEATHSSQMAQMVRRFNEVHGGEVVAAFWQEAARCIDYEDRAAGTKADAERHFLDEMQKSYPPTDSPLHELLRALHDSHYIWSPFYEGTRGSGTTYDSARLEMNDERARTLVTEALPEHLQRALVGFTLINTAAAGERFALLFENKSTNTRRIVTDTQCFELLDVAAGFDYLDISSDGQLVARMKSGPEGTYQGSRVIFDGERVMAHPNQYSCGFLLPFEPGIYRINVSREYVISNGIATDSEDTYRFLPAEQVVLSDGFVRMMPSKCEEIS